MRGYLTCDIDGREFAFYDDLSRDVAELLVCQHISYLFWLLWLPPHATLAEARAAWLTLKAAGAEPHEQQSRQSQCRSIGG